MPFFLPGHAEVSFNLHDEQGEIIARQYFNRGWAEKQYAKVMNKEAYRQLSELAQRAEIEKDEEAAHRLRDLQAKVKPDDPFLTLTVEGLIFRPHPDDPDGCASWRWEEPDVFCFRASEARRPRGGKAGDLER